MYGVLIRIARILRPDWRINNCWVGIGANLLQRQCLHSVARRRLDRIHAKREQAVIRSQELLRKLRKKRLEGLAESSLPADVELGEKLERMKYIRRLLSTFHSRKNSRELTLSNRVTILRKIADLFEENMKERALFLEKEFHHQLVQEIIYSITEFCKDCTPKELCVSVVALAKLNQKDPVVYAVLQSQILAHGLEKFSTEEIGVICSSFAKFGNTEALELFRAVDCEVHTREIVAFSSKDLCHIAWSFVELSVPAEKQLQRIGIEILSRDLGHVEPGMLAMLALAYSTVKAVPLADNILCLLERELQRHPELRTFPTKDLVALTVSLVRRNNLDSKSFRKLETVLVTRRDFLETVPRELLEELFVLLQKSHFFLAEIVKILETVLHPQVLNSVFDIFYRPRRSWKEKVLKQSLFRVY